MKFGNNSAFVDILEVIVDITYSAKLASGYKEGIIPSVPISNNPYSFAL